MGNKSIRVKYNENQPIDHLVVKLDQSFDFLEVLSLKIKQEDVYKTYTSDYGVLVGRVLANDGFGIPNAKVSIFIQNNNVDTTDPKNILYPYVSVSTKNYEGIRYNLLPSEKVKKCHQNVGSFPSKKKLLDNEALIEVFDDYYKFTTVTNQAGDYMIFGVPVGQQQIHVDIDLSDIGNLSQAPRDMEYKGYSIKQFDSPNKFKKNTNLDSLSQIITENTSVYIYPFWGDNGEDEISISKKNINVQYKFEPTCIFMGSIFTDSMKGGISKACKARNASGRMNELMASKGTIEMIRKTPEGEIEKYSIDGDRLINENGVWCYQIPMNLDYVITDEYGNIRPTDDPTKGIPTRSEVRFRMSLDNNGDEFVQSKSGVYLVPNNPHRLIDEDYEFSTNCKDSSFVNLMWNKVYSVKNYIPRLQKGYNAKKRYFSGIKSVNYHEDKNPMPYNNIWVNLNLRFVLTCFLTKLLIDAVRWVNDLMNKVDDVPGIAVNFPHIAISTGMLGDCDIIKEVIEKDYYIPHARKTGTDSAPYKATMDAHVGDTLAYEGVNELDGSIWYYDKVISCIETSLSSENEVVNFDFTNDWINGSLYAPRYLIKTKINRKNGNKELSYCGSSKQNYKNLKLVQTCAVSIKKDGNFTNGSYSNKKCYNDGECYQKESHINANKGIIVNNGINDFYYYRSTEFDVNNIKYYQPTDVILLGSLNDCDVDGIPQLHQLLPQTSFKLPPDSFEADDDFDNVQESSDYTQKLTSGIDWGNDSAHKENGLFVAISCTDSTTITKTCVNASRLCEIGVDLDEKHETYYGNVKNQKYIDGYISTDEISDGDARAMFATLNGNRLKTKKDISTNNQVKYDFIYSYPSAFDGRLKTTGYTNNVGYGLNSDYSTNILENIKYYYKYRFGLLNDASNGYDYSSDYSFPRYENSFYFYFGLKPGQTALDLFNTQYFVPCDDVELTSNFEVLTSIRNGEGICQTSNANLGIKCSNGVYPYNIYVNNKLIFYDINSDDELILSGLTSQYYNIKVIDGNNDTVNKNVFVPKSDGILYDYGIKNVTDPNPENPNGEINIYNIKNPNSPNGSITYKVSLLNDYDVEILTITGGTLVGDNLRVGKLRSGFYKVTLTEDACPINEVSLVTSVPEVPTIEFLSAEGTSNTTIFGRARIVSKGGGDIISYGFCWTETGQDPTINDSSINQNMEVTSAPYDFSDTITTVLGKTYNIRAYAINGAGVGYSDSIVIKMALKPNMSTISVNRDPNDYSKALVKGYVNSDKGPANKFGFVYMPNIYFNQTIDNLFYGLPNVKSVDLSSNDSNLGFYFTGYTTGLTDDTWVIKSYGSNPDIPGITGYSYSTSELILETPIMLNDITFTSPTSVFIKSKASFTSPFDISQKGVCWAKDGIIPIIGANGVNRTIDGNGFGEFNSSIGNLDDNTTYNVRSYIRSLDGTTLYSMPTRTFTTLTSPGLELTVNAVVPYTYGDYLTGGKITKNNDNRALARYGVIVSTGQTPTLLSQDAIIIDGTTITGGTDFNAIIQNESLIIDNEYNIRSFAINDLGVTGYSSNISNFKYSLPLDVYTGDFAKWELNNSNKYRIKVNSNQIGSGGSKAYYYGVVCIEEHFYNGSNLIYNGDYVTVSEYTSETGFTGYYNAYIPNDINDFMDDSQRYYYRAFGISKDGTIKYGENTFLINNRI